MKAFLETTQWAGDKNFNHVYWMDDAKNKVYAYAPWGQPDSVKVFNKPFMIDTRGRKFQVVRNTFGFVDTSISTTNKIWTVAGSKGTIYTIEETTRGLTCTCSGFRFRGHCKHLDQVSK